MMSIPLTQGKNTIVDDEDYPDLVRFGWYANKIGNSYYATRQSPTVNGKRKRLFMHAVIAGTPTGMETDHINGNGLDNRRKNLRIVSTRENQQNHHILKTSKYPGVRWHRRNKRWVAQISIDGNTKYLGSFKIEEDAAGVYVKACLDLSKKEILP